MGIFRQSNSPIGAVMTHHIDPITAAAIVKGGMEIVKGGKEIFGGRGATSRELRTQRSEGAHDRRVRRDEILAELFKFIAENDTKNQERASTAQFNEATGFSDEMLKRQLERLAPRPPATSFRDQGAPPAIGPGQGTGAHAGLNPDQYGSLGIGSFENFRKMKAQGKIPGPTQTQNPLDAMAQFDPSLLDRLKRERDF